MARLVGDQLYPCGVEPAVFQGLAGPAQPGVQPWWAAAFMSGMAMTKAQDRIQANSEAYSTAWMMPRGTLREASTVSSAVWAEAS